MNKENSVMRCMVIEQNPVAKIIRTCSLSPDLKDEREPSCRNEEGAFLAEGMVSVRTIQWEQASRARGTETVIGGGTVREQDMR